MLGVKRELAHCVKGKISIADTATEKKTVVCITDSPSLMQSIKPSRHMVPVTDLKDKVIKVRKKLWTPG